MGIWYYVRNECPIMSNMWEIIFLKNIITFINPVTHISFNGAFRSVSCINKLL